MRLPTLFLFFLTDGHIPIHNWDVKLHKKKNIIPYLFKKIINTVSQTLATMNTL